MALGLPEFERYASEAGVADSVAFSQCLTAAGPAGALERDLAAAKALGISETPSTLINGRFTKGSVDSATLIQFIRRTGR